MTQRLDDIIVVKKFRDKYDHETIYQPGFSLSVPNDRAKDLISRGLAVPAICISATGEPLDPQLQVFNEPQSADQDQPSKTDSEGSPEAEASQDTAGEEAAQDGNLESDPEPPVVNDAPVKAKSQKKTK